MVRCVFPGLLALFLSLRILDPVFGLEVRDGEDQADTVKRCSSIYLDIMPPNKTKKSILFVPKFTRECNLVVSLRILNLQMHR